MKTTRRQILTAGVVSGGALISSPLLAFAPVSLDALPDVRDGFSLPGMLEFLEANQCIAKFNYYGIRVELPDCRDEFSVYRLPNEEKPVACTCHFRGNQGRKVTVARGYVTFKEMPDGTEVRVSGLGDLQGRLQIGLMTQEAADVI